ncbi:MAG TPA: YceI family protein [Kofleriaceae bacterium]|nr:YceI family protein [Kofleriaceae bacterium]
MRSAFAPVAIALVALIAALARWAIQGSRNLYTSLEKTFYVPDLDAGWAVSSHHPVWLGLEAVAAVGMVAVGLGAAGWYIRRRERRTLARSKVLRGATWVVAALQLVIPALAFASGSRPEGGRDIRPQREAVAIDTAAQPAPITGALDLPAGRYEVVAHKLTEIAARLQAGGETFDARFAEDVKGEWRADPRDLAGPMTAEVSADAAAVDTNNAGRSKHAREGFLYTDKFPRLGWKLDKLVAARQDGPDRVAFRALGTVSLMGRTHPVEVDGALKKADAAALERLGLTGAVLIAEAAFSLVIKETALAPDAGSFKGDRFPIHVSLVLRHTGDR